MGFGIIGKDQVIERWDKLINGADGRGEEILSGTETSLEESKVPDAKVVRRDMAPGMMQGMFGGKRRFLVVFNTSNKHLRPYKLFINTRDYGINLQVSWYVVYHPSLWQKFMALILSVPVLGLLAWPFHAASMQASSNTAGILGLSLFDEQDLRAYVSNAHSCVQESLDKLKKGDNNKMPPVAVEKHSQGFLGIV